MAKKKSFGAKCQPVNLSKARNWPKRLPSPGWWRQVAQSVRNYPEGRDTPWGIPFDLAKGSAPRVIKASANDDAVTIALGGKADFVCFLHNWSQIPTTVKHEDPTEGLVVAEYELTYSDGSTHVQPVRARFEVTMQESMGPAWVAQPYHMSKTCDPQAVPQGVPWGMTQYALFNGHMQPQPPLLVYAMPNPEAGKRIRSLTIRGCVESPLLVAAVTMYQGADSPLRHLPRRSFRVNVPGGPAKIEKVEVDLGDIARVETTSGPRGKAWLNSKRVGLTAGWGQGPFLPEGKPEDLLEIYAAPDAKLSVKLEGKKKPLTFSVGEAFDKGKSRSGNAALEVLGRDRQWMNVKITDTSTGEPTAARVHLSGPRGNYIAPYGHHAQINTNWFEDYGADVVAAGQSFAYMKGEFTTDLPVGDLYVDIFKGFEYQPIRKKVTVRPGQKTLNLSINRRADLRSEGWVTADTHVHFLSPQTAWLEAQCEGINVVNLLASQWGRLFTNVGDLSGRVGVVEDDTIVYVGTENRNHMLGHMSMLGTKGLPVYPMCCGGPSESWVGDPDFVALAEWSRQNKAQGGVVIRPHFPGCGNTEDPVPILAGLVDALELCGTGNAFPVQEWYRYLNCGYKVAVCGGTDKMGAGQVLGWQRTYAMTDPNRPLTYDRWGAAVRAGRTFSTNAPLMSFQVDGNQIGDTIKMSPNGGTVEVQASANCYLPLAHLEVVHNGRVIARKAAPKGATKLSLKTKVRIPGSGWIAARCGGLRTHPGAYAAAHTSPVYVKCGDTRAFDGPAAEHLLSHVEGGIEYLNNLATVFDEASRKRMVKLFKAAQAELRGRLKSEADVDHHHGAGPYHTHGHGATPGHRH